MNYPKWILLMQRIPSWSAAISILLVLIWFGWVSIPETLDAAIALLAKTTGIYFLVWHATCVLNLFVLD